MDALPTWAPALSDVAVYVTSRTVTATDTNGTACATFTPDTFPASFQVTGILSDVCAGISAQVPVIATAVEHLARTVASLRTAGLIQLSFPTRDGDIPNGTELLKQADKALQTLIFAAGATATPDVVSPVGAFPPAPCEPGLFGGQEWWFW